MMLHVLVALQCEWGSTAGPQRPGAKAARGRPPIFGCIYQRISADCTWHLWTPARMQEGFWEGWHVVESRHLSGLFLDR
jgi:hypothetical protein